MQIEELLTPWGAKIGIIFVVFLRPAAVKRWENGEKSLAFGKIVGVGETMVSIPIKFSDILIRINLPAKININYLDVEYSSRLTSIMYRLASVGR